MKWKLGFHRDKKGSGFTCCLLAGFEGMEKNLETIMLSGGK